MLRIIGITLLFVSLAACPGPVENLGPDGGAELGIDGPTSEADAGQDDVSMIPLVEKCDDLSDDDNDGTPACWDCDSSDPTVYAGTYECPAPSCAETRGSGVYWLQPFDYAEPFQAKCESMAAGAWEKFTDVGAVLVGDDDGCFKDTGAPCPGSIDRLRIETCEDQGGSIQLLVLPKRLLPEDRQHYVILGGILKLVHKALLGMMTRERKIPESSAHDYPGYYGTSLEPYLHVVESSYEPRFRTFGIQGAKCGGIYLGDQSNREDGLGIALGFATPCGGYPGITLAAADGSKVADRAEGELYWRCVVSE